jgi:PBS lyase HEAT-like repeat
MWMVRKFYLLILCALLTAGVYGQQTQSDANKPGTAPDKAEVSEAIAKVESGDFFPVHVETIAAAGAVKAIPVLKEQFARSHDWLIKAKLASAVVRLGGDQDDIYWGFLVKQATLAVESDAPDFMNFDSQAKDSAGPSPAFTAWANAHKLDAQEAGGNAMYRIMLLSSTGDRRAIPLLRQGLLSPNHQIEYVAALGLAELQDKDSIPFILQACKIAPEAVAPAIAESLVYFNDPEAQKAVDTYVPKERARILREARAAGRKPL